MAYRGLVLYSTDKWSLVGYFVWIGLWPYCFLVSVLHGVGTSEDGEGEKWALPLEQVILLFVAGSLPMTQAGSCSCSLLLMTEHPPASEMIFLHPPFHPPPPAPVTGSTIPLLGKFGHSHSLIRPFSEAHWPSWDLNTGKKTYTEN